MIREIMIKAVVAAVAAMTLLLTLGLCFVTLTNGGDVCRALVTITTDGYSATVVVISFIGGIIYGIVEEG